MNRYHHTHTHTHMGKMVLNFLPVSWKDTPVSRASRRPRIQWTHAVCACLSPCAPARLTHAVPAHVDAPPPMCFSPRAPAHTQCLLTATPNNMYLSPAPTPEQNPRHSRPCAPARAAERRQHRAHTGTSGTTPHGKNESIARAGIESKQEWHDTARQKREHRTRWYRKLVLSGMIIQHTPPPDTAVELCMPCQALSTSARRNARGARDAGIGHAAFDR